LRVEGLESRAAGLSVKVQGLRSRVTDSSFMV